MSNHCVVSDILYVLRTGGRWRDIPAVYVPATTAYNRLNRWSRRAMLMPLAEARWVAQTAEMDSTYIKAHRCAQGARGRKTRRSAPREVTRRPRSTTCPTHSVAPPSSISPPGNRSDVGTAPAMLAAAQGRIRPLLADKGYNVDWLRADLHKAGIVPVIPSTRSRKRPIRHEKKCPKDRCRLKDFRRVATRYDKLARDYASAIALAADVAFWC